MKIKNVVTYGSLVFSLAAVAVTVHNQKYNEARFEQQQNTINSLEDENSRLQKKLENITLEDILDNLMEDLQKEAEKINVSFTYQKVSNGLLISANNKEEDSDYELSNQFYSKLNQFMVCGNIRELSLWELEDEIDFSRVDLSNVKDISFCQCNESFNLKPFIQNYHSICFSNTSEHFAINLLQNCDCSNTVVECDNIYHMAMERRHDTFMDIGLFAHYLVENDIFVKGLRVQQWAYLIDNIALTEQEINALSQVNTNALSITSAGNLNPINLNLTLNSNIQELELTLPSRVDSWVSGIYIRDLHDIKIDSDNPNLNIKFMYGKITENTHFSLPSSAIVNLIHIDYYDDVNPFYDLENVKMIVYEDIDDWKTDYNEETHIEYNRDLETIDDFINKMLDYQNNWQKEYIVE